MSFIRDEVSGKAVAANLDELSKYRAEKAVRRRISDIEHRLTNVESNIESINKILEEILRIMKTNG